MQIGPLKYRNYTARIWDEFIFTPVLTSYVNFTVIEMYDYDSPAFSEIQFWTDPTWYVTSRTTILNTDVKDTSNRDPSIEQTIRALYSSGSHEHYLNLRIFLGSFILFMVLKA